MYEIGRIVLGPRPGDGRASEDRELAAELLGAGTEEELTEVLRRLVSSAASPVRSFTRSPSGHAVVSLLRQAARQTVTPTARPSPGAAQAFVRMGRDVARRAVSLPAYAPQMAALTAAVEAAPRSFPQLTPQLRQALATVARQRTRASRELAGSRSTLRLGSTGAAVADLQRRLDAWLRARAGGRLTPDGVFGRLTDAAVRAFQGSNGLAADGVVGPLTWAMLLGGAPAPSAPSSPSGPPPADWNAVTVGPGDIVDVHGIRVHRLIADQVRRMVEAAAADGVALKGWGYRDRQRQIELRRAHCGTSDYDVYQKPSSQCTPPTAPPGRSRHEQGLTIDMHDDADQSILSSSPAFRWLAAKAERFGFRNLPSESWHWSVDGH